MLRIGERISRRLRCQAIVTGEALGQVGSQTLTNLVSIESAIETPVLRPLIGLDKHEIIDEARHLGTYETSIEPDMDCCQYLMPPKVATSSSPEELAEVEGDLDIEELVGMALDGVSVEEFSWPDVK